MKLVFTKEFGEMIVQCFNTTEDIAYEVVASLEERYLCNNFQVSFTNHNFGFYEEPYPRMLVYVEGVIAGEIHALSGNPVYYPD